MICMEGIQNSINYHLRPSYIRRAQKWKNVNAAGAKHLVNVNAANNLRGLHGFDSVELGGRVQVGKIQP